VIAKGNIELTRSSAEVVEHLSKQGSQGENFAMQNIAQLM
jgi:hypothetical protein